MPDVVRVSSGEEWFYVPVGGQDHQRLCRFAAKGMAESGEAEVRLVGESGPLFWEKLKGSEARAASPLVALSAMDQDGMRLSPGEKVSFGKREGSTSYNDFADLSLSKDDVPGVPLSATKVSNVEMVLTAWPKTGRLVPARVVSTPRGHELELVDTVPAGERCFVLDERGGALMTVSLEATGGATLRILPSMAVDSWLFSAGSKAARAMSSRFSLAGSADGGFLIKDHKDGRRYAGHYQNDSMPAAKNMEHERLEWLLASHGLAGALALYALEKA